LREIILHVCVEKRAWMTRFSISWQLALVFETSSATLQLIGNHLLPNPLDDARVVIAIAEVVVEGREAMSLACGLHLLQLLLIKFWIVDVSPIETRGIHRKARRDRAVGANDYIVLSCPAIPIGKVHSAFILHNARHRSNLLRDVS